MGCKGHPSVYLQAYIVLTYLSKGIIIFRTRHFLVDKKLAGSSSRCPRYNSTPRSHTALSLVRTSLSLTHSFWSIHHALTLVRCLFIYSPLDVVGWFVPLSLVQHHLIHYSHTHCFLFYPPLSDSLFINPRPPYTQIIIKPLIHPQTPSPTLPSTYHAPYRSIPHRRLRGP